MEQNFNKCGGLFGLRLSESLHFGHIVGNIRPAISDQHSKPIIVVLADLFTYTSGRKQDITVDNILSMTAESIALGLTSDRVRFVVQSQAFDSIFPLYTTLSCLLKFNKLSSIKPISVMLKENINLNFGELTFPVIQCAEMVSTNSQILYSNIDNLGIVSLTAILYKKLMYYTNTILPKPELKHGEFRNIKGIDYKKMSRSNNNAIFIADAHSVIARKITSIDTHTKTKEIDLCLLYDYFKVIGYSVEAILELEADFLSNKTTPQGIKNRLSLEIDKFFKPIREMKSEIMNNKAALIDRINSDTLSVKQLVEENTQKIFQQFYNNEFHKTFKH